jgi:hypothetical protein
VTRVYWFAQPATARGFDLTHLGAEDAAAMFATGTDVAG